MAGSLYSRFFWLDAFERLVKTGAQLEVAYLAAIPASNLTTFNDFQVQFDWKLAVLTFVFGAILSLFTSLASLKVGDLGTASAVENKLFLSPTDEDLEDV